MEKTYLKTGEVQNELSCAKIIIKSSATTMERKITDKKELVKLVSFLTMCDGGLYVKTKRKDGDTSNCNPLFIMNHTSEQYTNYAASILENVTSVIITDRKDYNVDNCFRLPQKRMFTKRHPFFRAIWERIYNQNYKGLDSHGLKLMDAECLAMLYMADGSFSLKGEAINSITLNTKRLTEGDNRFLAFCIDEKFNIETTIGKQGKYSYIRIKGKSIFKFFQLIKPYILSDFDYKVPNDKLLLKYKQDGDIVCSVLENTEVGRNDLP